MILDGVDIGDALKVQVVNRQHGLGAVVEGVALIDGVQIDRHQRRLPVVAVNDVRMEPDGAHGGQHRLGEEDKGDNVARHIRVGIASAEEIVVVDEVESHAVPPVFLQTHIIHVAVTGEVHVKVGHIGHTVAEMLGNACVARQHDTDVKVSLIGKRLGECGHDVGQTAGLYKRIAFRTYKQNIAHISSS